MKRTTWLTGLLLALCSSACSEGGGAAPPDGAMLYARQSCATCHGGNRQGSSLAPALVGIAGHWTVENLAAYLADPKGYAANDERLRKQGEAYRMPMTPYGHLSVEERTAIATWLLAPGG